MACTYGWESLSALRPLWLLNPWSLWGHGVHPHKDPWDREFSADYERERWAKAGTRLAGPFTFVLDGVQGDADFVSAMFGLQRDMARMASFLGNGSFSSPPKIMACHCPTDKGSYRRRKCCYLCKALSDVVADGDHDENRQELLYTHWGRDAAYREQPLALRPWLQHMRSEKLVVSQKDG